VDLAFLQGQVDVVVGEDAGEGFGDVTQLQDGGRMVG
jgi:hypothetical protein